VVSVGEHEEFRVGDDVRGSPASASRSSSSPMKITGRLTLMMSASRSRARAATAATTRWSRGAVTLLTVRATTRASQKRRTARTTRASGSPSSRGGQEPQPVRDPRSQAHARHHLGRWL